MNFHVKVLIFLVFGLSNVCCKADQENCLELLKNFGIEINEKISDSGDPNTREIDFIFDSNYQKSVENNYSFAMLKYRENPNKYLKTTLFEGGHFNLDPLGYATYPVFVERSMLSHLTLELRYTIDKEWGDNYIFIFIRGFENINALECREVAQ